MTQLTWGAAGERHFETGVDRGVLYLPGRDGIAWSGLTSVDESPSGGSAKGYYIDGYKYANVAELEEFEATIEAFSAPYEFGECDGTAEIHRGLFVTEQPRKSFSFTYRTLIGNDLESTDFGYKIHIVYNALAEPSSRSYDSLSDNPSAETRSWKITTQPSRIPGRKPTAHLIIDSTRVNPVALGVLEAYIYGGNRIPPRLPSPARVIEFIGEYANRGYDGPPIHIYGEVDDELQLVYNHVQNPRGAHTSGVVVIAENLFKNPSYEVDTNSVLAGTGVSSYNSTGFTSAIGSKCLSATLTDATSSTAYLAQRVSLPAGSEGKWIGFSLLARRSGSGSLGARLYIDQRSGGSGISASAISSPGFELNTISLPQQSRTVFAAQILPTADEVTLWLRFNEAGNASGAPPNNVIHTDAWVAVIGDTEEQARWLASTYFDGDYAEDPDFSPVWMGPPHASTSRITAPNPVNATGRHGCITYYSRTRGMYALRVITRDPVPNVIAQNQTYLIAGTQTTPIVVVESPIELTVESRADYAAISSRIANVGTSELAFDPGVNSTGTSTYWLLRIRQPNGEAFGKTLYFRAALVSDDKVKHYFDGDVEYATYENQKHMPHWTATPHQSRSGFFRNAAIPSSGREGDGVFVDGDQLFVMIDGYWTEIGRVPLP